MRIAVALMLTLMAAGALAGKVEVPNLKFQGDTAEGVGWVRSPDARRFQADLEFDGNDWYRQPSNEPLQEVSTCSPSYGATYGSFLDTMEEEVGSCSTLR